MELLIIKSGKNYIRVKDGAYSRCGIDKASVFPYAKLDIIKRHIETLKTAGIKSPTIYRLVIREEPLVL